MLFSIATAISLAIILLHSVRLMRTETFEQLKSDEAKYRGLFENAVEGIYLSTPDGRYLAANAALARMYGYDRPEELTGGVSDIQRQIYVDSKQREKFKQEIAQNGFVRAMEYQVRRRDNRIIWISESARAVRDVNGQVTHYEGFIDDITARKEVEAERARLEKQMLHAQKMDAVGTLAGGIAHDFNNILCAILGYTEMALQDKSVKGTSRDNLQAALKSAMRARDLVKRILTFSRPTDTERHPLKLSGLVNEAVNMLNATLPSSIKINVAIKTDADVVVADVTELHQVIMNLGTNAGHAMKSTGGRLDFEIENVEVNAARAGGLAIPEGDYVRLVVRDTGRGMTREVMEKIFEPFFTTKLAGTGTGLGLAFVHKIISRCKGNIRVESEVGAGTTFEILLPHSQQLPAPAEVGEKEFLPGHREQILVVDDEIPVLSMMQQRLRQMGYRVTTRADSLEALETFRAEPNRFVLVITDNTMPGLQGVELAEKIGAIRAEVPVILMTGLNQLPDFGSSRHSALRAVFQKPLDFVELSRRLRKLLDRSTETRHLHRDELRLNGAQSGSGELQFANGSFSESLGVHNFVENSGKIFPPLPLR